PPQTLTYQLVSPPAGVQIDSTGIITWTPTEAQGPGVYNIKTVATDSGIPAISVTNTFSVTVNEGNSAPSIQAIPDTLPHVGATLSVTAVATDPDTPTNTLTFSLANNAPAGMTITPSGGVVSWTPVASNANISYPITVIVTDNGTPPLSASNTFNVNV